MWVTISEIVIGDDEALSEQQGDFLLVLCKNTGSLELIHMLTVHRIRSNLPKQEFPDYANGTYKRCSSSLVNHSRDVCLLSRPGVIDSLLAGVSFGVSHTTPSGSLTSLCFCGMSLGTSIIDGDIGMMLMWFCSTRLFPIVKACPPAVLELRSNQI